MRNAVTWTTSMADSETSLHVNWKSMTKSKH